MPKRLRIILCALAALCLWGCGPADMGQTTGSVPQTAGSTESVITTTVPAETPLFYAQERSLTDKVPEYDTAALETIFLEVELEDGFEAKYLHVPNGGSHNYTPYDGQALWVCQDAQETKSGSRYDVYVHEDNGLQKLENKTFSMTYTLFGTPVTLELVYAEYEDQVFLTYEPVRRGETVWARIEDCSRGVEECLAAFSLGEQGSYYAIVDLRTGKLTDFLSAFDTAQIPSGQLLDWKTDNSLVIQTESGQGLAYVDVPNTKITVCEPEALLPDVQLAEILLYRDGIVCYAYTNDAKLRCDIWWVSLADGEIKKVLSNVMLKHKPTISAPFAVYCGPDNEYILCDLRTGERIATARNPVEAAFYENALVYTDGSGSYCIVDLRTGQEAALQLSQDQAPDLAAWHPSPDGKKLLTGWIDVNETVQLLLYDLQSRTLTELQRENPNSLQEAYYSWAGDEILIYGEDRKDFCLYDLVD